MEKFAQSLENGQAYSQGKGDDDMLGKYLCKSQPLVEKSYEMQRVYCKKDLFVCHIASYRTLEDARPGYQQITMVSLSWGSAIGNNDGQPRISYVR